MPPNENSSRGGSSPTPTTYKCNNIRMNKSVAKQLNKSSTYVSIDRLYEIARQLAKVELTANQLVDTCVSLLDLNFDCNIMYNFGGVVNPPTNDKNYCEVVSVPTSNHVAQIVGKQGSKIKLLRAKSKTYIQTPVSGEEPVFIITGSREEVLRVKHEILSASEHFTAISDERHKKLKQNSNIPGAITMNLITPVCLIGLIVGRNGNTIRKLQETTKTYIETPNTSNKNTSIAAFKISGQILTVQRAVADIINHVKSKNPDRTFKTDTLPNGDLRLLLVD